MKLRTHLIIAIIYIIILFILILGIKVDSTGISIQRPVVGGIYVTIAIFFIILTYYKYKNYEDN